MRRLLTIAMLVAATHARAQVWWATQDINGVVGPVITTNVLAGSIRITLTATDGASPVDLTGATLHMLATERRDTKVIASNTCVSVDDASVRGEFSLSAINSPYDVRIINGTPETPVTYYWATVVVTSTPSASLSASISVSNAIGISWQPQWEIDGQGDLRPYGMSRDLVPYTDLDMNIGSPTQRVGTVYASNLVVDVISGSIEALDTGAVHKVDADYTTTVALAASAVQPTDPTYTAAVAQAGSAVQTEADPVFAAWQPNALTNDGATVNGVAISNGAAITITAGGDIYSTSNNAFGSPGSPRTNTFHGRIIARDPGNVAGAPVAIELDASNDVGLVLSSVDNGANAEGTTIAPKMEIVSYAGGGYATMRRTTNAAAGAGSWPVITMVQFASTPWMQLGFVSDAGGTVSNVVDIYGTTFEFNPQSRTNVNVDIFGKTGLWARITGHEQFGLGTLQPQAGLHVSNRTLRVDGRFVLGGNSGRNQLTAGVCNIVLPYRMVDTNYTVQLSGETAWDSPAREWANGKTISNFVANGTTSNWFAWEVKGYTL